MASAPEQAKALAGAFATLVATMLTALVTAGVEPNVWLIGLVVALATAAAWAIVYYVPNRDDVHERDEAQRFAGQLDDGHTMSDGPDRTPYRGQPRPGEGPLSKSIREREQQERDGWR